jgi:hypothetical protein
MLDSGESQTGCQMTRIIVKCWFMALFLGFCLLLDRAPAVQAGPVPFEQLLPFVAIKIPGWEASAKPVGSIRKEGGGSTSQVKASFRSGDKTLEIMIIDFPGNGAYFPETGQMERESSEGYVRHITIQGFAAQETYTKDRHGELHIYVEYRFMVVIEGSNLDNTEVLKMAAKQMDLKKLAALAKK